MSWGANLKYEDGKFTVLQKSNNNKEHDEQYTVALKVAQDVIESGAVGSGDFTVTLSGHGNPNHEKLAGWGNDFVQITVSQQ